MPAPSRKWQVQTSISCESRSFFISLAFHSRSSTEGGSHSNQQVEIIEIFVVGKTLLQKISAPNSAVDVVKVRVWCRWRP